MNSFVSIVVPVRESNKDILNLLNKLELQTYHKFEVIIVDSSESINIKELIKPYFNNLNLIYKHVDKAYPGRARNLGVQLSNHSIISFLDIRTIPNKAWLEKSISMLQKNNLDFFGSKVKAKTENKFQDILRACSYGKNPMKSIAGSLILKNKFYEIGLFNEDVRAGEDLEWISRLEQNKLKISWTNFPYIDYLGLPKTLLLTSKKWFIYSLSSSKIDIQKTQKFVYSFILIFGLIACIYSWNYIATGGQWSSSPYFIPHITTISLVLIATIYFIFRAIILPYRNGYSIKELSFFRIFNIGALAIYLDILKAPGRVLGAISLFFQLFKRKQSVPGKSIFVLCPYPYDEAAGQRLKYEQYFQDWEDKGYKVKVSSFFSYATWKILHKEGYFFKKLLGTFMGYIRRFFDFFVLRKYEKIYVFMWITPLFGSFIERLFRLFSKELIFDFDDSIHKRKNEISQSNFQSSLRFLSKTNFLIKASDAVITSSPYNLDYCLKNNQKENAAFIPCSLDTNRFIPGPRKNDSFVTIGWTGTFSSANYLDSIKNVFIRIASSYNVKILLITNFDYKIEGLDIEVIRWKKNEEIKDLQRFDIGVYPVIESEWALGKGGLKVMQYMALGIPSVSTNYGMSKHLIKNGSDGFLVNTEDEWVSKLSVLIKDEDLRYKMGDIARQKIINNYSVNAVGKKYRKVIGIYD